MHVPMISSLLRRSVQDHLLNFLQVPVTTDGDINSPTHLSLLVTAKADSLVEEFDELCTIKYWTDVLYFAELQDKVLPTIEAIIIMVMLHAAQYDMRITKRLHRWPYKLLLLCESPGDEHCELRKSAASDLLVADVSTLEVNALKVRSGCDGLPCWPPCLIPSRLAADSLLKVSYSAYFRILLKSADQTFNMSQPYAKSLTS